MSMINKFNNTDIKTTCVKCSSHKIENPDFSKGNFDWKCLRCNTRQLEYIKSKGFRYYAYLLSGSWTSKYIYARSIMEGYKRAVKMYKDTHEVYKTYLVGGVDSFVLKDWQSFN